MAKSLLRSKFDEAAMLRKLKKTAKGFGESQKQAVKRWGVHTCRQLAKYTQPFGGSGSKLKRAMFKDGSNVIFTHDKAAKKTGSGYKVISSNGKPFYVSADRYLNSVTDVTRWINQNRVSSKKRTRKLPIEQKKVCKNSVFRRAINQRYKQYGGMAKDGWLDAGEEMSKKQKGKNPEKVGKSLMKWARKPARYGGAKVSRNPVKSFGILNNKVAHVSTAHVLSNSNKSKAVRDGAMNTLKWYRKTIKAEAKKTK